MSCNNMSGAFLKHLRQEYSIKINKKVTQPEMARLLELSLPYLSQLERGLRTPSDLVRIKYAKLTGTDLNEIFLRTLKKEDRNYYNK